MDGLDRFCHALDLAGAACADLPRVLAPFAVACVQQHISEGAGPANAPLTALLKGGGKGPLKDSGALRARITSALEPMRFRVGSNGVQDRILNDGGTIEASGAKKLAIPVNRAIKRMAEQQGVRGYLAGLTAANWRIFFGPRAIIGTPPRGVKGQGVKVAARARPAKTGADGTPITPRKRKGKRLPARVHYVLFIRKASITIPPREYMILHPDEVSELGTTARDYLRSKAL